MNTIALARKWRPRTFSELLGQESLRKVLENSLLQNRLHHAYLFTGTRGVGKTSVARIFAKALNCERGVSASPCLVCSHCLAVDQGSFIDLIEVDGASRTRVEDTRELLENFQYLPSVGRYKIYLIDEVHMLSNHSFNALLKTLEEPPAHAKIFLATTEPQKLPITILSRCLQFHLKPLTMDCIAAHLQVILQEEQFQFEPKALQVIAKAAKGSARDALSILDQVIAGSSDHFIDCPTVHALLGYTQQDYALPLLNALANLDAHELIHLSRAISAEGGQYAFVLEAVLHYLHQISILQLAPETKLESEQSDALTLLAQQLSPQDVQLFYQIGIKGQDEMHLAPTPAVGFDMTLLRMVAFKPQESLPPPALAFERKPSLSEPTPAPAKIAPVAEKISPTVSASTANQIAPEAPKQSEWSTILHELHLSGLTLSAAENAVLQSKERNRITLQIEKHHRSLFTKTVMTRLEKALSDYYGESMVITVCDAPHPISSPAYEKILAKQQNQALAEESIAGDAFVNKLQEQFSAELVKSSIAPLKNSLQLTLEDENKG